MKEYEIRPEELLSKYIELSNYDAESFFTNKVFEESLCIACGGNSTYKFTKNNFSYCECNDCKTLYLNPRPSLEVFKDFYQHSKSCKYWAEIFYPVVAEIRREKIIKPRVKKLASLLGKVDLNVKSIIDVGAGYGIFLDEWRKISPDAELLAIEPSSNMANKCRENRILTVENIVENVQGYTDSADLVVCFEVLEHVSNPLDFMAALSKLAKPGGYVFVSTLSVDGFDLQVLREKSSQISPPHHINFLSIMGLRKLFGRANMFNVMITTPGQLDVDIVRNAMKKDSSLLEGQSFLKNLLADDGHAQAFQIFLSEQCLSSHAWVLARKPELGGE